LFGTISATMYQEFKVIKINRRGRRQERIFGIDGNHIYNKNPKSKEVYQEVSTQAKKKESFF